MTNRLFGLDCCTRIKLAAVLFLLLVAVLALSGCVGPAGHRVEYGIARDTLFSVERTYNEAYSVFLTHDDSVLYCTTDREMGERALDYIVNHDGEVIVTFRFRQHDDQESAFWGPACESYYDSTGAGFSAVVLLEISPVDLRGHSDARHPGFRDLPGAENLLALAEDCVDTATRATDLSTGLMADLEACRTEEGE